MARKFWHLTVLSLFVVGCSQPTSTSPKTTAEAGTGSAVSQNDPNDTPDHAVTQFLDAVRAGNDQVSAAMLTPTARQKTKEMQMEVAPPVRPSAKFTIGQTEYVNAEKDGAYVGSTWTDTDSDGNIRTDKITWVLRHEAEGWRIAGMVTKVFPDQPPLVLNFEDPEDMLRKQQLLQDGGNDTAGQTPASGQQEAQRVDQASPAAR
jgi:hypothetical protein